MRWCFILLISLAELSKGSAGTIIVSKETGSLSIQQAVGKAMRGDTILIRKGVYREGNIQVDKSLTILGEGYPVLDGEYRFEVLTLKAAGCVAEGLKIINSGRSSINDLAGVNCQEADHSIIRNNILENTFFGIHLAKSNYCRIENNRLHASATREYELGNGIHLWYCNHALIRENLISGHRDGIYFEFVTESMIRNNISDGNMRYGLHFMYSHNNTYQDNLFRNNGAGVAVMYTRNVKMIRNKFNDNWGAAAFGLLLKDITGSIISGNEFSANTCAIYMEGTNRCEFENNNFRSNGWGIKLQASCENNTFSHNNFESNTFDVSTNSILVLNKIDTNYWDKYQGYDLNRDGTGDVPHLPVNIFSMIVERVPPAVMLWRSFLVLLLDRAEKVMPAITPENLKDNFPAMQPYDNHK